MTVLSPNIILPNLELQYIKLGNDKYFRILSDKVNPLLIDLLNERKIRLQFWLEKQVKKKSGAYYKRSWVHSRDFSSNLLFANNEYYYGQGDGWGWKKDELPSYCTTDNGLVPTEFEITSSHIINGRIEMRIPVLDIFSCILKINSDNRWPITGDSISSICFSGRSSSPSQPIRFKMAANYNGKALFSLPSIPLVLGIHKNYSSPLFNEENISSIIKVSYYK